MTPAASTAAGDIARASGVENGAEEHLLDRFDRTAAEFGQSVAIELPPTPARTSRVHMTYSGLDRASRAIAAALEAWALRRDEPVVAIALGRDSPLLYAAQIAAWRAGAAFTCVDLTFPVEHVRAIVADAGACAFLSDESGLARLAGALGDCPPIDVRRASAGAGDASEARVGRAASSLAYVVYTSGTTGAPKGVQVEHRSIANLVRSDVERFRLSRADRVAQCSSPAYDSSLEETWLAFSAGAVLVPLDDETVRLGPDLVPWLRRERISVLCPPPTLLRTTGCTHPARELPHLKLLYVGGEALPQDLADRWGESRWLENGYGPTECTVTVLRGRMRVGQPVTIGRPIGGHEAWAMDERLEPVPDGEEGELCIAGMGLARGYRNRPELTAERFPTHPRFGRIYRTGDLVRRRPNGDFEYLGRIDGQVKVRGYRIELPAIEAHLAACDGVREAACAVQEGTTLVAHVVASDPGALPDQAALRSALRERLPSYMVPSRIGFLDELPRTVGGKLDRKRLPPLDAIGAGAADDGIGAGHETAGTADGLLRRVCAACAAAAKVPVAGPDADFFIDLGGDSLGAVELLCLLRGEPQLAHVAVRDLYAARTPARIAALARSSSGPAPAGTPSQRIATRARMDRAAPVQALCLLAAAALLGGMWWLAAFVLAPALVARLGIVVGVLLAPFLLFAASLAWAPLAVGVAAVVKAILIGRYEESRIPVASGLFVRHWIVEHVARLIPWSLLEGTEFHSAALRSLGARVGERVHIHRGVDLRRGGWDLLEIGDDVTLAQESSLQLVDYDDGHVAIGPVRIGSGSTVGVRATVSGGASIGAGAELTALSWLKRGTHVGDGQRFTGVPAQPDGASRAAPSITRGTALSPTVHAFAMLSARLVQNVMRSLPAMCLLLGALAVAERASGSAAGDVAWFLSAGSLPLLAAGAVVLAPIGLLAQALGVRWLGRVEPGVISRFSVEYAGVWAKTAAVATAGRWLSGTLFWPWWLRIAGMRIGRRCEVSTIIDVLPETVSIGDECFFADGIYFCSPVIHRGTVTIANTSLGDGTFVGNHAVIPAGHAWPRGMFVGVSTVADQSLVRPDSGWFGHPPMELPRREVVTGDRSVTFDPSAARVATRVFWESLRFALPAMPLALAWWWATAIVAMGERLPPPVAVALGVPLATVGALACLVAAIVLLKWTLLGRVRPGQHPLWSCWCSRWDFLFVAWTMWARNVLTNFDGTIFLTWFLRAMGVRVGRDVVLGIGFAQVVDPDMLSFGDGATVACNFQAHTFEDRILKIDRVRIGAGATVCHNAVVFYGADIGGGAHVAPHGIVMKNLRIPPNSECEGAPVACGPVGWPSGPPRAE